MDTGRSSKGNPVSTILDNPRFLHILRWIIAGIFLYAGIRKIQAPEAFADSIATFQLLPKELINLLALGLPPFEIIVAVLLLTDWKKREAAFSILVTCIIFTLALTQGLLRGLPIDCGCMGSGEPSTWHTGLSLTRDLLLLSTAWIVYRKS